MKKMTALLTFVLFAFILTGSSATADESSRQIYNVKFSCPYLNMIHSNSAVNETTSDEISCPYLKSQKIKKNDKSACPYKERQKQIYYEMNKKRAAEIIKSS